MSAAAQTHANAAAHAPGPSDVREGGAWSRRQKHKNDLLHALARLAVALLAPLPSSVLRVLGRALGLGAYAWLPGPRRLALANARRAMPHLDARTLRRLVRRAYAGLGSHLGDTVAMLGNPARFVPLPLAPGDRRVLEEACAEGRGVVFASAHLGPWERVAGTLVASGFRLTTIARGAYDPRLTALYDRVRRPLGLGVIYRGMPGAPARIVRVLRTGGLLGAPMDLRTRAASVDAPFLGHPAATAVGPARLALRTRAPVVVGTVAPRGAALGLTFTRIPTKDLAAGESGELELTARINAELSSRILALPDAWVWMHPRW
jgi:KDO2-lipid IV(A) lauroyltransferase